MNLLKSAVLVIATLCFTSGAFAESDLKIGQTVLVKYGYDYSKERVTDISQDGLVRTTVLYGNDYLHRSEIRIYRPVKSLATRSWLDILTEKSPTTIKVGDQVLVKYGYDWKQETVTDLTADGLVRTTVRYGNDYLKLGDIKPYHSVQ